MSRYSVLFPPSRYHTIGPFRLPVYNNLLPGETKQIESMSKVEAKTRYASIKLAKKIATDKSISMDEAIELLGSMQTSEDKQLIYEYLEDIEELNTSSQGEMTLKSELVTIVLRYRGEVQFPEDETYVKLKDWAASDTEVLPPAILDMVYQFVLWERDGWPEPGKPETQPTKAPPTTTKS